MLVIEIFIGCLIAVPLVLTVARLVNDSWFGGKLTWGAVAACWALPCFVLAMFMVVYPRGVVSTHLAIMAVLTYLNLRGLKLSTGFIVTLWLLVGIEFLIWP